jgi:hypothetical protein
VTAAGVRGRNAVRVILVAVVAGLAAMWVYVLFIGKVQSPNRLADQTWAPRAEPICASTAKAMAALPPAASFQDVKPKAEALRQRAVVGQEATDLLRRQLAELRALPAPTGPNDGKLLAAWFADWDRYLADRQVHVEDWEAGNDHPFAESETEGGGPITDRMDSLSDINGMPSCEAPLDFG